jgi:hypothetical protein
MLLQARPVAGPDVFGGRMGPTLSPVIGPLLLLAAGGVAGWFSGGWPGAAAGMLAAGVITLGVAVAAAWWVSQVGRFLEPAVAWEVAPRPPLFGGLCDRVYRRVLRIGDPPEGAEREP